MISVIVPVYRVAPYLRQCVESIINQSYKDLEILLIDDGSPDECGEICEEYKKKDSRIIVFHTENRGLSAARNLGLTAAKGEYLGFIDSDDGIEPDMYETLLKRMEDTNADISGCGFWTEYPFATKKSQIQETVYEGEELERGLIDGKISNYVWNKLYRKSLFQNISFPEGRTFEEIASMHKIISEAGSVADIADLKYHYRIRPESITKTYTAKNLMDYADAHLDRYFFFKEEMNNLFLEKHEEILGFVTNGISKVWRWWYGCSSEEKIQYSGRIKELHQFTRENIPLFGYRSWPGSLRISAFFMHSNSNLSFAVLYALNQVFRKLWPEKANVV